MTGLSTFTIQFSLPVEGCMIDETIHQYVTRVPIKISRDLPILVVRLKPTRTTVPPDHRPRADQRSQYFLDARFSQCVDARLKPRALTFAE